MRKLMSVAVLAAVLVPATAVAQTAPIEIPKLPVTEDVAASMRVSDATPRAGDTITVEGSCGPANSDRMVNFFLDANKLPATADNSQGKFMAEVTIPEGQPQGPTTLVAECTGNSTRLTTQLNVQPRFQAAQAAQTDISVSNASPQPGETITVDGTCGPTSADQTVNFFLDGEKFQTTANSDNQGRFSVQLTIPQNRQPGPANLVAECTGNGQRLTTQLQIQAAAQPAPAPAPAPVPAPTRIEAGGGGTAPGPARSSSGMPLNAGLATALVAGLVALRRLRR